MSCTYDIASCFHGIDFEAWVLARHRLCLLRIPDFVHTPEEAVVAVNRRCYICLSEVPPPEPCGCACGGTAIRHVHVPCLARRVGPNMSSTRFRFMCTTCDVCNFKLSPELVARTVVDLTQDSVASSELRKALQAEVIGAAQCEDGSVTSSIATLMSGFTVAHRLLNDVSTSKVVKDLALAASIRISEWLAMAHALGGNHRKAEQVMEHVMARREGLKLRSDAANFLALVTENNAHVIRALRRVPPSVTQRQYEMFVKLCTSPWRTDSWTVALHASNLAACLYMQAGASFKDIELSARLSNFALDAVTIACGPQHRDTQLVASNNAVVLGELDRHGAESDGSTRGTRIRTQVRPGYWPGLMKPVITRDAGTCHIPRLGRTVC